MNLNGVESETYQFTRFSSIFTRFRSFFIVSNVFNALSMNGLRWMELKELFIPSFPRQCSAELFETDRWAMCCVMGTNKLVFSDVSALFTLSGATDTSSFLPRTMVIIETSGLHLMV